MTFDFDRLHDRRASDSIKWNYYPPDALPLWVADMDFPAPEPILVALRQRVEHGIFGYPVEPPELRPVLVDRLQRLYGWQVSPEDLIFLPGVINGFNLVCHALGGPGTGLLIQVPVYPPFFSAPRHVSMLRQEAPLTLQSDGSYSIDFDAFETAITPATRLFLLCNPHNPVGRVFRQDELERLAEICLRHDLFICSDEIHCDLIFPPRRHLPIASLAPEIARRTVTLMSPSKTFNLAGLKFSFAVVQDADLRKRLETAKQGLVGSINIFGYVAALAAYRDAGDWLTALVDYLQVNRDILVQYLHANLPQIHIHPPEGTYLAWLDCRNLTGIADPFTWLLESGKVALNDGRDFGAGGAGFLRLNFGCPRSLLLEGLERIRAALTTIA